MARRSHNSAPTQPLRGTEWRALGLLLPYLLEYKWRVAGALAALTAWAAAGGGGRAAAGRAVCAEAPFRGVGFGLGVAVVLDAAPGRMLSAEGEYSWGGAASTAFFVDPASGLTVSFFTQLLPSSAHPIRSQLRQLVYQALQD